MRFKGFISVAVSVLVMLFVLWGVGRIVIAARAADTEEKVSLAQDTVQAAQDTSRALPLIGVLGDSLRVAQRRAIQVGQRADKLDAALKMERVARERLEASMVALRASIRSDTVYVARGDGVRRAMGDSVRHATFDLRRAPYTVHADVSLPAPPAAGQLDVRVELDTLALETRVGCGAAGSDGVRPASVTVVGPAWAPVRLDGLQQSPGVCSASALKVEGGQWPAIRRFLDRFGLSVGYAAARGPNGVVVAGPGMAVGFRVWP